MFKHISKVVLASFLLTGAAQAAELYKDDNNTFTVNVKAQAYAVHDNFGFVNGGKGRNAAPVELNGKVQVESYYTRKFNEDLSATAYIRLDTPMFGYMNTGWGGLDKDRNIRLGTYDYINKVYGKIDHKEYGTLVFGRYQGAYSIINDYSDLDIFIGTPAHNTVNTVLQGGSPETGFMYNKKLFSDKLTLAVALDGGQDQQAVEVKLGEYNENKSIYLKKDYKATVGAQYNITDTIKAGAAYNITSYRASSDNTDANNNNLGREVAHSAIVGINYTKGGTIAGLTGSIQNNNYDHYMLADSTLGKATTKTTSFGIEAGVAYDISGQGVGFRPQVQFDYKRSYTTEKDKVLNISQDSNLTNVQAVELGLSYYVTPNLYYQAAAILDLRSDKQIEKADALVHDSKKTTPHHFFGVGVVYKF